MAEDFARLGDLMNERPTRKRSAPGRAQTGGASPAPPRATGLDLVADLAVAWPLVVGDEVAANSQPVRFKQGRLVVAASSSVWAQTLHFMEGTIAAGLNERLGGQVVEHILFRHAGWEGGPGRAARGAGGPVAGAGEDAAGPQSRPDAAQTRATEPTEPPLEPAGPLSADEQTALRAVRELGLDPQLEQRITRTMMAAFVRRQRDSVR